MTNDQNIMRRIKVAAGLRELAAFIETNLDLPLPLRVEISHAVIGESNDAEREEIDRIGRILRETPRAEFEGHHYTVTRKFGPVTFTAIAITREYMARYVAKWEAAERYARQRWGEDT